MLPYYNTPQIYRHNVILPTVLNGVLKKSNVRDFVLFLRLAVPIRQ